MTSSKELQIIEPDAFMAIRDEQGPLSLEKAFKDYNIEQFDLPQLRVPAGGATSWDVETLEGSESVKTLEVILVSVRMGLRKWYRQGLDETEVPGAPECSSPDGITGLGFRDMTPPEDGATPTTQECATCPHAQWGSARRGKGQDCKAFGLALCLMPDTLLPAVLNVPVTSLSSRDRDQPALKNFLMRLLNGGRNAQGVVTKLSLVSIPGPPKYSRIVFEFGGDLDPEAAHRVEMIVNSLGGVFDRAAAVAMGTSQ